MCTCSSPFGTIWNSWRFPVTAICTSHLNFFCLITLTSPMWFGYKVSRGPSHFLSFPYTGHSCLLPKEIIFHGDWYAACFDLFSSQTGRCSLESCNHLHWTWAFDYHRDSQQSGFTIQIAIPIATLTELSLGNKLYLDLLSLLRILDISTFPFSLGGKLQSNNSTHTFICQLRRLGPFPQETNIWCFERNSHGGETSHAIVTCFTGICTDIC